MTLIDITTRSSLIVQVLTGVYQFIVWLTMDTQTLLREALTLELGVQFIEALFYTLFVVKQLSPSEMLTTRYYDWMLTTPTMLVSLLGYLVYTRDRRTTWKTFWQKNRRTIGTIIVTNALMLLFGYLARVHILSRWIAWPLSWLMLFITFGIIFLSTGPSAILQLTFGTWAGYGIAEIFGDETANTLMNGLDLIAKNIFGILLSTEALTQRQN